MNYKFSHPFPSAGATQSALLAATWQVPDDLAFDAGARAACIDGQRVFELQADVTFGFRIGGETL